MLRILKPIFFFSNIHLFINYISTYSVCSFYIDLFGMITNFDLFGMIFLFLYVIVLLTLYSPISFIIIN